MTLSNLDLMDVIALDKVQKKQVISDEEFKRLKAQALIEGRRPNLFVSAKGTGYGTLKTNGAGLHV